jgi:hypothetical protein
MPSDPVHAATAMHLAPLPAHAVTPMLRVRREPAALAGCEHPTRGPWLQPWLGGSALALALAALLPLQPLGELAMPTEDAARARRAASAADAAQAVADRSFTNSHRCGVPP